ncbi:MAG: DNA polymerase III subunit delta [Patescibacteria group bacterium]|nr:DNA polymerase III subunit delta [Patescibacteria group bacterium]
MIHLFYGENSFEIEEATKKLRESTSDAEVFNITGEDIDTVANMLLSESFFSPKRIFIFRSYLSEVTGDNLGKLTHALAKISKDTLVIFIEDAEPKKFLKSFKAKINVKNFPAQKGKSLITFIKQRALDNEVEISPLAAERLATFVGPNYWQLAEEVKKLALYKKDDQLDSTIDTADVDLLVKANFEANIFELMDAIAEKNSSRAVGLLNSFLESGENEIYILTMIARQFRNIAMAKFDEAGEVELAKKAGLHPYVAKKSYYQARNFEEEEIIASYRKITKADLSLKSGQNPKAVLLGLVI